MRHAKCHVTSDGEIVTPTKSTSLPTSVEQQLNVAKRRGLDDILPAQVVKSLNAAVTSSADGNEPLVKKLKSDPDVTNNGLDQSGSSVGAGRRERKPRKLTNFLRAPSPAATRQHTSAAAAGDNATSTNNAFGEL